MFIIVAGDPINGFAYYGPFNTRDEAERYIDQGNVDDDTAWPVTLIKPFTDTSHDDDSPTRLL